MRPTESKNDSAPQLRVRLNRRARFDRRRRVRSLEQLARRAASPIEDPWQRKAVETEIEAILEAPSARGASAESVARMAEELGLEEVYLLDPARADELDLLELADALQDAGVTGPVCLCRTPGDRATALEMLLVALETVRLPSGER